MLRANGSTRGGSRSVLLAARSDGRRLLSTKDHFLLSGELVTGTDKEKGGNDTGDAEQSKSGADDDSSGVVVIIRVGITGNLFTSVQIHSGQVTNTSASSSDGRADTVVVARVVGSSGTLLLTVLTPPSWNTVTSGSLVVANTSSRVTGRESHALGHITLGLVSPSILTDTGGRASTSDLFTESSDSTDGAGQLTSVTGVMTVASAGSVKLTSTAVVAGVVGTSGTLGETVITTVSVTTVTIAFASDLITRATSSGARNTTIGSTPSISTVLASALSSASSVVVTGGGSTSRALLVTVFTVVALGTVTVAGSTGARNAVDGGADSHVARDASPSLRTVTGSVGNVTSSRTTTGSATTGDITVFSGPSLETVKGTLKGVDVTSDAVGAGTGNRAVPSSPSGFTGAGVVNNVADSVAAAGVSGSSRTGDRAIPSRVSSQASASGITIDAIIASSMAGTDLSIGKTRADKVARLTCGSLLAGLTDTSLSVTDSKNTSGRASVLTGHTPVVVHASASAITVTSLVTGSSPRAGALSSSGANTLAVRAVVAHGALGARSIRVAGEGTGGGALVLTADTVVSGITGTGSGARCSPVTLSIEGTGSSSGTELTSGSVLVLTTTVSGTLSSVAVASGGAAAGTGAGTVSSKEAFVTGAGSRSGLAVVTETVATTSFVEATWALLVTVGTVVSGNITDVAGSINGITRRGTSGRAGLLAEVAPVSSNADTGSITVTTTVTYTMPHAGHGVTSGTIVFTVLSPVSGGALGASTGLRVTSVRAVGVTSVSTVISPVLVVTLTVSKATGSIITGAVAVARARSTSWAFHVATGTEVTGRAGAHAVLKAGGGTLGGARRVAVVTSVSAITSAGAVSNRAVRASSLSGTGVGGATSALLFTGKTPGSSGTVRTTGELQVEVRHVLKTTRKSIEEPSSGSELVVALVGTPSNLHGRDLVLVSVEDLAVGSVGIDLTEG